ncbi:interleukin-22 [Scleropages formosus]|uniref:interleukin-22 n=1 Tax=Scleropages formosus TaxID=113540 RepID=UPI000878E4A3|nr:interleukin-22 [Scleropages formosus]
MQCAVTLLLALSVLPRESAAGVIERRVKAGQVRSAPLDNPGTSQRVRELAWAAQQLDDDHEIRLIPSERNIIDKTNLYICCLHANILDFYLGNILQTEEKFPHLSTVTIDLARISRDLSEKGCSIKHVNEHEHSRSFTEQFHKLGKKGQTKAIGEIDILFDYLSKFC